MTEGIVLSSTRIRLSAALFVSAALLVWPARPTDAQILLNGRVTDDISGAPISEARVFLLNEYRKVVGYETTGSEGSFSFTRGRHVLFRLEAKAIGYQEAVTPLVWMTEGRDTTTVEIRMRRHATLLAPLEIVAMSPPKRSAVLENVEHRRELGLGQHLTREEIQQRRATHISDVLVTLPGVFADKGRSGPGGRSVYMKRAIPGLPGGCPVRIFVDGVLANRGGDRAGVIIDDLVSPLDVAAIEVFKGLSSIPPEFLTPEARCGVIAIWTQRTGSDED